MTVVLHIFTIQKYILHQTTLAGNTKGKNVKLFNHEEVPFIWLFVLIFRVVFGLFVLINPASHLPIKSMPP